MRGGSGVGEMPLVRLGLESSARLKRATEVKRLLQWSIEAVNEGFGSIENELRPWFDVAGQLPERDHDAAKAAWGFALTHKADSSFKVEIQFGGALIGSDLIITGRVRDRRTELLRKRAEDVSDKAAVGDATRRFVLAAIRAILPA